MLGAGDKENVLPAAAHAILNMRLLPGDGSAAATERVRRAVAPCGAAVSIHAPESLAEAMGESPAEGPGWEAIISALAKVFPEAAPIPFLFAASTDTKHYRALARNIYRLTPVLLDARGLASIHAADERISLENLGRSIAFYDALMRSCGGGGNP
jgi:carboxypeptidase PM20D1